MEFIIILGLLGVFLIPQILLLRKQRRRQQEILDTQRALTAGTRVVTASGMHGRVVSVQGDAVELEISPGVVTTWELMAVVRNLDEEDRAAVQGEQDHPENQ